MAGTSSIGMSRSTEVLQYSRALAQLTLRLCCLLFFCWAGLIAESRAAADLSVSISGAPDPVTVGDQLSYHITVNNLGPDPATGIVLTQTLPAGVEVISST